MNEFYTANILRYVEAERLPLWVEYVARGTHIEWLFHDHEFSEIAIVLQGHARHMVNKTVVEIAAGDVLVIHPGLAHAYDKTGDLELVNIVYDCRQLSMPVLDGYSLPLFQRFWRSDAPSEESVVAAPVMNLSQDALAEIAPMVKRLENELTSYKPGNSIISLALFLEILVLLARHNAGNDREHRFRFLVGTAIEYMNRNLARKIDLDDLISVARMSRRDFFRKFRSATGCSPTEYLLQLRTSRAAALLQKTNLSLNEIAAQCGFYDSNYLCRVFRERMKTTPRRFRLGHSDSADL